MFLEHLEKNFFRAFIKTSCLPCANTLCKYSESVIQEFLPLITEVSLELSYNSKNFAHIQVPESPFPVRSLTGSPSYYSLRSSQSSLLKIPLCALVLTPLSPTWTRRIDCIRPYIPHITWFLLLLILFCET